MSATILTEKSIQTEVPNMGVNLFPHQKATIHAMIDREMSLRNEALIAILSSCVGSGKSAICLGLIQLEKVKFGKTNNLLVIPSALHEQWLGYIHRFTPELKIASLMYYDDVIALYHDARILSAFDILITTESFLSVLAATMRDIKAYFCRVFIDEVDSISLYTRIKIPCLTMYLISATSDLTTNDSSYLEYIKPENEIKCDPQFIEKSMKIPPLLVENHICYNKYVDILQKLSLVGSGDNVNGLVNFFSLYAMALCEFRFKFYRKQITSAKDLLAVVYQDHILELYNLYNSIEFSARRANDDSIRETLLRGAEASVSKLKDGETIEFDKIQGIGEKSRRFEIVKKEIMEIANLCKNKICAFCGDCYKEDTTKKRVATLCCDVVYHESCLNEYILKQGKCPVCVAKKCETKPQHILVPEITKNVPDKLETLMNVVNSELKKPNCKILIFSDFEGSFPLIKTLLDEKGIKNDELHGNHVTVAKSLEDFKNGDTKILFVHSGFYGSGHNLEFSTACILFNKSKREAQLVGRANRIGRVGRLSLHHILYENEK